MIGTYQLRLQQLYMVKQLLPLSTEILSIPFSVHEHELILKDYLEELLIVIFDVVYFDHVEDGYIYEIPVPPVHSITSPSDTVKVICDAERLVIKQSVWIPMLIAYTVARAYEGGNI